MTSITTGNGRDVTPSGAGSTSASDAADASVRSVDARLARLHLRGGAITLARAELETMAGHGTLDREALADLAEARWRSGDLVGGGEAARAHLDAGGSEPLAMVVAAEALAADGRLVESRQLATKVAEQAPGLVDRLFAGQARSHSWASLGSAPGDVDDIPAWGLVSGGQDVVSPGRRVPRPSRDNQPRDAEGHPIRAPHIAPRAAGTLSPERPADRPLAAGAPSEAGVSAAIDAPETAAPSEDGGAEREDAAQLPVRAGERRSPVPPDGDASPERPHVPGTTEHALDVGLVAGRELGVVEDAIARGETSAVAARLALVLRLDRALAPVILSLADRAVETVPPEGPEAAALHLVRGDAYRLLGHEGDATAAYQRSRLALGATTDPSEETT